VHSGIVHQDVNVPEGIERGTHQCVSLCGLPHIRPDGDGLAARRADLRYKVIRLLSAIPVT
jgi:hypothetical protein